MSERQDMKVLVTGANGQLGYDVINELKKETMSVSGWI